MKHFRVYIYIYIYIYIYSMAVQANLRPSHNEKTFAMKAERTVKHITFDRNEAKPLARLCTSVCPS